MILTLEDYKKTPFKRAIVDTLTTNKSFIEMASLYKNGFKLQNWAWPLILLQPELQGVDPYSTELTEDQMYMIMAECKLNPVYFIREVVRIDGGGEPIQFKANRANMGMIWCWLLHIDVIQIQPRQTGKSVSSDCMDLWAIFFSGTGVKSNLITKDNELRIENVSRLKVMRDYLPAYLISRHTKDGDNQMGITYTANRSKFTTHVGQKDRARSRNVGRGHTAAIWKFDEPAFTPNIDKTVSSALAAGTTARIHAKRLGQPYVNIFITTAGDLDDLSGQYMYDMYNKAMTWNEIIFDQYNIDEINDMVNKKSKGLRKAVVIDMNHRQLGLTDEWLRDAIGNAGGSMDEINRDFLNIWTRGGARSPFTKRVIKSISDGRRDVVYTERSRENYVIEWYITEEELNARRRHGTIIGGLDSSEMFGRDNTSLVMLDISDLTPIGVAAVSESSIPKYGAWLARFMAEFKNFVLIPERKSTGSTLNDILFAYLPQYGKDPFKCIYSRVVEDRELRPDVYKKFMQSGMHRDDSIYEAHRKDFGFVTTAASRDMLYKTTMNVAIQRTKHNLKSATLISELFGLEEKRNRIDHSSSTHDDTVIAWLLAQFMLNFGKHLEHYGINQAELMSRVVGDDGVSAHDQHKKAMVKEAKSKTIEHLKEALVNEKDTAIAMRLERRLVKMISNVAAANQDTYSVAGVMSEVKELRRKTLLANANQMGARRAA